MKEVVIGMALSMGVAVLAAVLMLWRERNGVSETGLSDQRIGHESSGGSA